MRRGAGKLQVIFACIFSRPTARNLTRLNACGSWFGAAVFTTATLQPWMTSSLLLNLYSKFGPAQTLRCNVSVGFFNIMQLFMSLPLIAATQFILKVFWRRLLPGSFENFFHFLDRQRNRVRLHTAGARRFLDQRGKVVGLDAVTAQWLNLQPTTQLAHPGDAVIGR